jgi:hypothetical protein
MSRDDSSKSRRSTSVQIGDRFTRLVVVEGPILIPSPTASDLNRKVNAFRCRCDCGNLHVVSVVHLRRGGTKSCGCLRREYAKAVGSKTYPGNVRHGFLSRDASCPEYHVWQDMIQRCLNPKEPAYHNYGGRGITICDEWREDFTKFFADMGARPTPQHSIDRIDNNGPYSASNCRWATKQEQSENRRNNVYHEYNGQRYTQTEWGRINGIPEPTISLRLKRGWSVEDALTKKSTCKRGERFEYDGKNLTLGEWSRVTGIAYKLLHQRLKNGWAISDALTTPSLQKPKAD